MPAFLRHWSSSAARFSSLSVLTLWVPMINLRPHLNSASSRWLCSDITPRMRFKVTSSFCRRKLDLRRASVSVAKLLSTPGTGSIGFALFQLLMWILYKAVFLNEGRHPSRHMRSRSLLLAKRLASVYLVVDWKTVHPPWPKHREDPHR